MQLRGYGVRWTKRCKDKALAWKVKEVIHQVGHSKKWASVKVVDENGELILAEETNGLYIQMIGAEKAGIKKSRKTYLKGVLMGILTGMAAWLVIAGVFK